jgi:hypothetical protein
VQSGSVLMCSICCSISGKPCNTVHNHTTETIGLHHGRAMLVIKAVTVSPASYITAQPVACISAPGAAANRTHTPHFAQIHFVSTACADLISAGQVIVPSLNTFASRSNNAGSEATS